MKRTVLYVGYDCAQLYTLRGIPYHAVERAATLITVGVIFGCIFMVAGIMLFISEDYHRKRFRARVYID